MDVYRMHTDNIDSLSRRESEAPAIFASGRPPLSHAGLFRQVQRIAAAIRAAGVQRGDRVVVILPNGPEMAACFLGVASAGACAPLNPAYRESEFAFYFDDLQPKLVILQKGVV